MITFRRIGTYVAAEPFRPFRITTTSGRTFDIRHPEMIQVGRSTMTIFTHLDSASPDANDEPTERQIEISLLLTESAEPLDSAVRQPGVS